ncbi:hypothetical protein KC331_g40 [Hortaea werneckii]|nr:hypothetical protein KC331_g40 [Hortaea werneckii]
MQFVPSSLSLVYHLLTFSQISFAAACLDQRPIPSFTAAAAAAAGCALTTSLIYPIDVAKTLYQKALLTAGARPDRRSHSSGLAQVSQYRSSEDVWLGGRRCPRPCSSRGMLLTLTRSSLSLPPAPSISCLGSHAEILVTTQFHHQLVPVRPVWPEQGGGGGSLLLPVWKVEWQVGAGGQDWDERDPVGPSV